ncbi:VCBS repeat-containing protein [Dokdonella sp.]|uniref:FG-GAP repeat domain-containing protein n=1 Tax=Dokdonella sp. TaxID=2291710 RepID=UPI002BCF6807|nr:VCBS repeat-containing protein [Dokdonella sp.]HPN80074.1 VCBS repeat-containing protein [Dokdonella sp.]
MPISITTICAGEKSMRKRISAVFLVLCALSSAEAAVTLTCPTRSGPGVPNDPPCQTGFPSALIELGNDRVSYSSPTIVDLNGDGSPEIVFGTEGGRVVAVRSNGTLLWSYKTGTVPVQGKAAVADIDGDGQLEVVVGAGSATANGGGIFVVSSTGQLKCSFTDLNPEHPQGMYSSPAVGRLDPAQPTKMQIAVASFDFRFRVLRHDCSVWWQFGVSQYVVDSIWSSPSIVDLDRDGTLDIVIGADSNFHSLPGIILPDGGMLRAMHGNGSGDLPGFPRLYDDVVYSSPAIGDIRGIGELAISVGSGRCWDLPSCAVVHAVTKQMLGVQSNGQNLPGFPVATPAESSRTASPALAEFSGINGLVSIFNTLRNDDLNGVVHAIRPNGTELPGWPLQPNIPADCVGNSLHWGTIASPVAVNLLGDSDPEIILNAANEFVIWNRSGQQLTAATGCPIPAGKLSLWSGSDAFYNTPAVADIDGNTKLEVVGAGTNSAVPGHSGSYVTVYAWTFPTSTASADNLDWPMFRRDRFNSGVYLPDRIFRDGFESP